MCRLLWFFFFILHPIQSIFECRPFHFSSKFFYSWLCPSILIQSVVLNNKNPFSLFNSHVSTGLFIELTDRIFAVPYLPWMVTLIQLLSLLGSLTFVMFLIHSFLLRSFSLFVPFFVSTALGFYDIVHIWCCSMYLFSGSHELRLISCLLIWNPALRKLSMLIASVL